MASTGLNFANITPDNGAVRELSQLIFMNVLGSDKLSKYLNVLFGQHHGDKIAFVGEFGLLGKAGQGCEPTYNNSAIATGEKAWDIKEWGIYEKICYADLESTLVKLCMQLGTSRADLTSTQYMAEVIMPRLELAVYKMLQRLAWFGDKAADTVTNGGILKDGTDKEYFTVTDGLWKRLYAIVTADASRRTEITANTANTATGSGSAITFAAQKAAMKVAGYASGILDSLIEDADPILRETTGQVIYVTNALKDALNADIRANNKGSELQWQSIFGGIQESTYAGIQLVSLPMWDEIIKGYEGTTTYWNKPYRALYTVKENLLVGIESKNEFADLEINFDPIKRNNHIIATDKLGTQVAQDNMVQVAY